MVQRRKVLPAGLLIAMVTTLVSCASLGQAVLAEAEADAAPFGGAASPLVGADVGAGWNILSIPSDGFQTFSPERIDRNSVGYWLNAGSMHIDARAPVLLPSGAAIGHVALFAYDTEPTINIRAQLQRYGGYGSIAGCSPCGPPTFPNLQPIAVVLSSGASGYQYARSNLDPPHIVDNNALSNGGQYSIVVTLTAPAPALTLGFRGVEIWWKRQISPAPGVASFVDVPTTHLFFREIEALKEAGITLGCTASTFCPDASLTRAQMAAFLARALGLYWQF